MGHIRYVLPTTTKPHPDFYRLDVGRCQSRSRYRGLNESYLAPWPERVAVTVLTEIGTLSSGEWTAIVAWLRRQGEALP